MTVHTFTPQRFYQTFGSHEPALRIQDGDTVVTTTLDCRGFDAQGGQPIQCSNPLTGPFYVAGAEVGDTLVVHLERLAPHPQSPVGASGAVAAAHVVDPAYVRELPVLSKGNPVWYYDHAVWRINHQEGTATLLREDTMLKGYTLPLSPMLGCLGVAPEYGQAIHTSTSGPYGGNMDYRGLTNGATAYFPVFVPGALLYMGDGHAIQGDGEITGMGIEIPFEVQFQVRLLKGKTIRWPHGENATHIFTMGNARPLDQALQHATTEMLRWLQSDYGFDAIGAQTLLGVCVEYEIGNVYDPAYTVVCKLNKKYIG